MKAFIDDFNAVMTAPNAVEYGDENIAQEPWADDGQGRREPPHQLAWRNAQRWPPPKAMHCGTIQCSSSRSKNYSAETQPPRLSLNRKKPRQAFRKFTSVAVWRDFVFLRTILQKGNNPFRRSVLAVGLSFITVLKFAPRARCTPGIERVSICGVFSYGWPMSRLNSGKPTSW